MSRAIPWINTGGDSLSYLDAAAVPLRLEKIDNQNTGGVLLINLDAPLTQNVPTNQQKGDKPSALLIGGIAIAILLSAMMLWAIISRKDDPLVSVEDYRKK